VLVIDDEDDLLVAMKRLLRKEYEVTCVKSAAEALGALEDNPSFEIVLCDLMMPEKTGMDLYEAAGARYPGIEKRFIFMTGGAFTERAQAFLEEVNAVRVSKPFSGPQLREAVATIMRSAKPA
jgi:CheY-like chemotaxis protein